MSKILLEINDKDEREKTTYFVLILNDTDGLTPKKIQQAITETWKIKDYTVNTLRSKLDLIDGIEYLYDCTNPDKAIMELQL